MKKITIALFSLILAGCSSFFEDFDYPPATFSVSGNSLVMEGGYRQQYKDKPPSRSK